MYSDTFTFLMLQNYLLPLLEFILTTKGTRGVVFPKWNNMQCFYDVEMNIEVLIVLDNKEIIGHAT